MSQPSVFQSFIFKRTITRMDWIESKYTHNLTLSHSTVYHTAFLPDNYQGPTGFKRPRPYKHRLPHLYAVNHLSQSELTNTQDLLEPVSTSSANQHLLPRQITQSLLIQESNEGVHFLGVERREKISSLSCHTDCGYSAWCVWGHEREMDWEFWSKQLDEEVLVENGEFGSRGEFVGELCLWLGFFLFAVWESLHSALLLP